MSVALLVIRDGRDDYHERSLESAAEALSFVSVEEMHRAFARYGHWIVVDDSDHALGFGGAIREGWQRVLDSGACHVLHLEADFTFNAPVPLARMVALLDRRPHLAQLVLKRQAWNEAECAAGGIVECHPGDFTECRDDGAVWTEHRRFWSTNPAVYSSRFCRVGWPAGDQSEGMFTHKLLADPLLRFAFWGGKFDAPLVEHIGRERVGVGY